MRADLAAAATLATFAVLMFAGCASPPTGPVAGPAPDTSQPFLELPAAQTPSFAAPVLLDTTRAGGEPVIAVTHAGTLLVSAHPGFTHYFRGDLTHPPAELVTPVAGQSYLWRSTDHGATWTPIGLPVTGAPAGFGPRGPGLGVSDPEFTVMADGAVCTTDLEALAAASVSCSLDDGLT